MPICPCMSLPPKPWPTGTVEQLEPLVARVLAPNASPYTFTGTQTYVVGNGAGVVVIDPGPDDAAHRDALMMAIGDTRVIAITCTHTHRDHSPGAAPLAAQVGAPIIGCAPLALKDDGPNAHLERADAAFDLFYRPDSVMVDDDVIDGGDFGLRAIATPGHTSNHLCYALELGADTPTVLFTGDHVMGWSTSVVAPPDGDMADYLASLERLYTREDSLYYPAHGPVIDRPRQLVRGMIGHRRSRERQILKLLAEAGPDAPLPIADMVARMYRGLDERLWGAAGRSVLAHLIDLERRAMALRHSDTHWAPADGGWNE